MSRFDAGRRGRIAVWTGAALAWGTAVTLAGQEPAQAGAQATEPPPSLDVTNSVVPPLPTMPDEGLVIIRYQPSVTESPEVRTVYVKQAAPANGSRAAAPTPAPAAPAPAPQSGGS